MGIGVQPDHQQGNLPDRPCCSICSGCVFVTDMSPAARHMRGKARIVKKEKKKKTDFEVEKREG